MTPHHVGYMVADIGAAREEFIALGYSPEGDTVYDAERGAHICFLRNCGLAVELICPASPESPYAPLLKRYKNAPYHVCYETSDLDAAREELSARGYVRFRLPEPAPALGGRRVAFFMHGAAGMVELVERG